MSALADLLSNNRRWAAELAQADPNFFPTLARQQRPDYLWIGCADSRVPANQIVDLLPGTIFVHRNIANLVHHTDLNCLSVLQFAVEVLQIQEIIVCGHYGCGGVQAVMDGQEHGLIDNWLRPLQGLYQRYAAQLERLPPGRARVDCLCELNVIEQVFNVCQTTIVRRAWAQGAHLTVHGWIYGVGDGILRDLQIDVAGPDGLAAGYARAVAAHSGDSRAVSQ